MYMKSVFRWIVSSGLACALVALGLNPVAGQTTKRSGASQEVRRLSVVIGGSVQIADGVSVGKIEDVVLNDRGCIDYVVVVYRDKYVAIPWSVATVDYGERIVTVDITERRFAEVPTFTRTEFSVLTKSDFTQQVRSAFGGNGESKSAKAVGQAESAKATKSDAKTEAKADEGPTPRLKPKRRPKTNPPTKRRMSRKSPRLNPMRSPKTSPATKRRAKRRTSPRNRVCVSRGIRRDSYGKLAQGSCLAPD